MQLAVDNQVMIQKLQENYERLLAAKELYDSMLDKPPKDTGKFKRLKVKIRYAREEVLKLTLNAKKILSALEKDYQ